MNKKFKYFGSGLSLERDLYKRDRIELSKQITEMLSIRSGLSQTCHCENSNCGCKEMDKKLQLELKKLKLSVKNALYLNETKN